MTLGIGLQPQTGNTLIVANVNSKNYFKKGNRMTLNLTLAPIVSLIAGILILIMPRLLNYIVALYLIIIGCIGIFGINL
jgi:DUF3096 family protein